MFTSRYLIDSIYAAIFLVACGVVVQDIWTGFRRSGARAADAPPVRWRTGIAMITLAWLPIVIAVISGGF
jgi:hypothetical protein